MKALVTGANGFLGQHLCIYLAEKGMHVIAAGRGHCRLPQHDNINYHEVELTDANEVQRMLLHHKPGVVIHTSAMSKPDECDNNKDLCRRVNIEATQHLLRYQADHFIYISTDFIFGEDGPHSEEQEPDPLNFYGETKLAAEHEVKKSSGLFTIVRPVFIYGKVWDGLRPTFLHWVKNNLENDTPIKVVSDQYRTPTFVGDLCKGIYAIIDKKAAGDFHLAGKDILSPYQMAVITANMLGLNADLIQNVTSETFPEPVRRAKRSGLKIDKAIEVLNYNPVSFDEGVKLTFSV